jgi:hypothetical protein
LVLSVGYRKTQNYLPPASLSGSVGEMPKQDEDWVYLTVLSSNHPMAGYDRVISVPVAGIAWA